MTNTHKDTLFVLIKSLSKSEKRQFKLYVGRLGVNTDAKYLALFNLLDKMRAYDEKQILDSGIVKKAQLSNLKAHLYRQILVSLRLNPVNQNIRVQIREQLDFATILYQKGLYKQSLKLLEKAKTMAIENEEKNVAYEIVELEKIIEKQGERAIGPLMGVAMKDLRGKASGEKINQLLIEKIQKSLASKK